MSVYVADPRASRIRVLVSRYGPRGRPGAGMVLRLADMEVINGGVGPYEILGGTPDGEFLYATTNNGYLPRLKYQVVGQEFTFLSSEDSQYASYVSLIFSEQ